MANGIKNRIAHRVLRLRMYGVILLLPLRLRVVDWDSFTFFSSGLK